MNVITHRAWINAGVIKRSHVLVLIVGMAFGAAAQGKACTPQDAVAADAMIDHLDSWSAVSRAYKTFGHCDDGSIAEGNSEAVARLLVDQWHTLPLLAQLIKGNPRLKEFVLRHIDTTLETGDLEKIARLSASSCPKGATSFCRELNTTATRAVRK